jgi:hypothetical protein
MKSNYYDKSVELGTEFQKNNPNICMVIDHKLKKLA